MSRFIAIIFFLLLFLSLAAVLASEFSASETTSNNLIPVFFFGDQCDGLLTIAPIEDDLFTWSYLNKEKILIGNITNKSDIGNYTYFQSFKINPHAVTSAGSTNYTYDDNGNITSDGTHTYTWDYNNRPLSSTTGSTTYAYYYDHEGNRVKKVQGANTTIYANRYYEIDPSGKITKHIYGGDDRIALIETVSGIKTPYYVHKDHLGGSSVITDSSGNKAELVDYYPYGSTRLDEKAGSFESKYKFTGKELDSETGLYYYGQRYYNPSIGRWVSEDPMFLFVAVKPDFKTEYIFKDIQERQNNRSSLQQNKKKEEKYLLNPQYLNSYSYTFNNPLKHVDPNGEFGQIILGAGAGIVGQYAYDVFNNIQANGLSASAFTSNLSSGKTYTARAFQGGLIAASGGAAAGWGLGAFGQSLVVGATSGTAGVIGDVYLGQPISAQSIAIDTVFGGVTFGAAKSVPSVPGRLPNFGTNAFFAGKHTQQSALRLGVDSVSSYVSSITKDILSPAK